MFTSRVGIIKISQIAHFLHFLLMTAKKVIIFWAKYLMQKKDIIESFQEIIWLIDFGVAIRQILTFYFIMLKNDQTFFKNLAV